MNPDERRAVTYDQQSTQVKRKLIDSKSRRPLYRLLLGVRQKPPPHWLPAHCASVVQATPCDNKRDVVAAVGAAVGA